MSERALYRVLLWFLSGAGFVAGFAYGLHAPMVLSHSEKFPVEKTIRFGDSSSDRALLDKGWGKEEIWGIPMRQTNAAVVFGFDGPSAGDVDLFIEAHLDGSGSALVIVRYNETELARWQLSPRPSLWRRRFVIPEAVFNKRMDGKLTFESSGGKEGRFGLQEVTLRDARPMGATRGFVDGCARDRLSGWAISQETPVTISATVDGRALAAVFTNVYRPDLEANGIPPDAGFELRPLQPIAAGSTVEVRFPHGRHLIGSPCQPK